MVSLLVAADGHHLLASNGSQIVLVPLVGDGEAQLLKRQSTYRDSVSAFAFDDDSSHVILGHTDGHIAVAAVDDLEAGWAEEPTPRLSYEFNLGSIDSIAPMGPNVFMVGYTSGTVGLWRLDPLAYRSEQHLSISRPFLLDGRYDDDGTLHLVAFTSNDVLHAIRFGTEIVDPWTLTQDDVADYAVAGRRRGPVALATNDGTADDGVSLWEIGPDGATKLGHLPLDRAPPVGGDTFQAALENVYALPLNRHTVLALTAPSDLVVLDVDSGVELARVTVDEESRLLDSASGYLVVVSETGFAPVTVTLNQQGGGTSIDLGLHHSFPDDLQARGRGALHPDGTLAQFLTDGTLRQFDVGDGAQVGPVVRFEDRISRNAIWIDDDNLATYGGPTGALTTWNRRTGERAHEPVPLPGRVLGLTADGAGRVAVASTLGVYVLDAVSSVWTVARPGFGVVPGAVSLDDGILVAASATLELMVVWDVNPDRAVARMCDRIGRSMTPDEWELFVTDLPYRETCSNS